MVLKASAFLADAVKAAASECLVQCHSAIAQKIGFAIMKGAGHTEDITPKNWRARVADSVDVQFIKTEFLEHDTVVFSAVVRQNDAGLELAEDLGKKLSIAGFCKDACKGLKEKNEELKAVIAASTVCNVIWVKAPQARNLKSRAAYVRNTKEILERLKLAAPGGQ